MPKKLKKWLKITGWAALAVVLLMIGAVVGVGVLHEPSAEQAAAEAKAEADEARAKAEWAAAAAKAEAEWRAKAERRRIEAEEKDRLNEAAESGTADDVKFFLALGVDPNARDVFQSMPLHRAAAWNPNPSVILALLKAGADVNARMANGFTPLHQAARMNSNPAVIVALIEAGADPGARDDDGKTPFDYAKGKVAKGTEAYRLLNPDN